MLSLVHLPEPTLCKDAKDGESVRDGLSFSPCEPDMETWRRLGSHQKLIKVQWNMALLG